MESTTRRMDGWTCWVEEAEIWPISSAVVSDQRIAFDTTDGSNVYTVELTPAAAGPPWWKGVWRCKTDGSKGHAEARLYSSTDRGLVLVGRWVEDGDKRWVTELRP